MSPEMMMAISGIISSGANLGSLFGGGGGQSTSNYQFHENLGLNWRDFHENQKRYQQSIAQRDQQWDRYTQDMDRTFRNQEQQFSDSMGENRRQFDATMGEARRQYEDTMRNSISHRVNDAERAGVHPAIALGMGAASGGQAPGGMGAPPPTATGANGPPVIDGQSNAGGYNVDGAAIIERNRQGFAEALGTASSVASGALHDWMQVKKAQAELEEIKSRENLNYVEAAAINSRQARAGQQVNSKRRLEDKIWGNPGTVEGNIATTQSRGEKGLTLMGRSYNKRTKDSDAVAWTDRYADTGEQIAGFSNFAQEVLVPNYKEVISEVLGHAKYGAQKAATKLRKLEMDAHRRRIERKQKTRYHSGETQLIAGGA